LFSCLTGLRFSDVSKLTWSNVTFTQGGYYINFRQLKTKYLQDIPITQDVVVLM
jgi:integrase